MTDVGVKVKTGNGREAIGEGVLRTAQSLLEGQKHFVFLPFSLLVGSVAIFLQVCFHSFSVVKYSGRPSPTSCFSFVFFCVKCGGGFPVYVCISLLSITICVGVVIALV